jgi:hypothetical protein
MTTFTPTPAVRRMGGFRAFAPLGIRFWDAAFDLPVEDGLVVHAWLRGGGRPPARAVRSPGGVYGFHPLPGHPAALPLPQPGAAGDPPVLAGDYVIAVDDPAGRYLPAAFTVSLPLGYPGEFLSSGSESPPAARGRAYLFSAPTRPVPAGAAAIRADLEDADTGGPAAWAVLHGTVAGRSLRAVADAEGRALLLLPVPKVDRLQLGSPPGAGQGTPAGHAWPLTLAVRYQPTALRRPFAGAADVDPRWRDRPSLKSILDEQAPALVWTEEGQPPVGDWTADLVYAEPLTLRTLQADGSPASTLWVSAGASPP